MTTPSIGSNGPQGLKRKLCQVLVNKENEFLHQHLPQYSLLSSVTKRILFIVHHTPIKSGKQTSTLLVQTHSLVSPQVKNICMLFILHLRSLWFSPFVHYYSANRPRMSIKLDKSHKPLLFWDKGPAIFAEDHSNQLKLRVKLMLAY